MAPMTHAECQQFENLLDDKWDNDPDFGWKEERAMRKAKLATTEDRKAWSEYMQKKSDEAFDEQFIVTAPSEIYNEIDQTNFSKQGDIQYLTALLAKQAQPLLPLGVRDGVAYQLSPNNFVLEPLKQLSKNVASSAFGDYLLGVALNVAAPPLLRPVSLKKLGKHRRDASSSEDSMKSTETDDLEPNNRLAGNAFCFFQLGVLQEYGGEDWNEVYNNVQKATNTSWYDTRYVVVMEVSQAGKAGALWIISNTQPKVEGDLRFGPKEGPPEVTDGRKRIEIPQSELLRTDKGEPFHMIKIANSIQDINVLQGQQSLTRPLEFDDSTAKFHEPYIVSATKAGMDQKIAPASLPIKLSAVVRPPIKRSQGHKHDGAA